MKFCVAILLVSLATFAVTETVEYAWESYKKNPDKVLSPGYVAIDGTVKDAGEIADFEIFKKQWDEAKAFNSKYSTIEIAWEAYKV